jgi:hypothetical protein
MYIRICIHAYIHLNALNLLTCMQTFIHTANIKQLYIHPFILTYIYTCTFLHSSKYAYSFNTTLISACRHAHMNKYRRILFYRRQPPFSAQTSAITCSQCWSVGCSGSREKIGFPSLPPPPYSTLKPSPPHIHKTRIQNHTLFFIIVLPIWHMAAAWRSVRCYTHICCCSSKAHPGIICI